MMETHMKFFSSTNI